MADKSLTPIDLPELSSAPASPASGFHRFYAKTDGKAYSKNSSGTEYDLTGGGGGGIDTLTTTGTSGAATLVGTTLNIPIYQSALTNPVTGTGTAGQVAYWDGTNTQTGSNNLFWDAANGRLGVGLNTGLTARTHIRGSGTTSATTALLLQNSTPTALLTVRDDGRIQQTIPGTTNTTVFGNSAGNSASLTGNWNAFFGAFAGRDNTSGVGNSFFGFASGSSNTNANDNSFFGRLAGNVNTGSSNSFFGSSSGLNNTTGTSNVFIGVESAQNNLTGSFNISIGRSSGNTSSTNTALTTINNSIFLGYDTRANGNSQTNQIVIGHLAIGNGSNTVTLGHTTITATYLRGSINYTDGGNFVFGTTTGTKIGTATTEKLSFWNATPIVQPTNTTAINDLIVSTGLRASGGISNFSNDVRVDGVFLETVTTNRQTASYTLALSDRGKLVEMNVASANNLTVPLNSSIAFPVGTKIDIVQYGAGQTTIVATGGVTINSTNNWLKINAKYGAVTLVKIATDEWYVFGNLNA